MLKVMFDVDGVLADFVEAFTLLANVLFGLPILTTKRQPTWNFTATYMTKQQENDVWKFIRNSRGWWTTLIPLASPAEMDRINRLSKLAYVYFVTSRVHDLEPVTRMSATWLEEYGIYHASVIATEGNSKKRIAYDLGVNYSIEDNYSNAAGISESLPYRASYLINRLYNQEEGMLFPARVDTVSQFLDIVEAGL